MTLVHRTQHQQGHVVKQQQQTTVGASSSSCFSSRTLRSSTIRRYGRAGSICLLVLPLIWHLTCGGFGDFGFGNGNGEKEPDLKLAVLVAGSAQRFLFDSFAKHVARPAMKKAAVSASASSSPRYKPAVVGIDYFAILTLKSGAAFRQDAGYMGRLAGRDVPFKHVLFPPSKAKWNDIVDVDAVQNQMLEVMTEAIRAEETGSVGGSGLVNVRALRLLKDPIESAAVLDGVRDREIKKARKRNKKSDKKSEIDFYQQFPMLDFRQAALARTKAGNHNMIRLFLALESLWDDEFSRYEASRTGGGGDSGGVSKSGSDKKPYYYDYVLVVRDDALWLGDFDLKAVLDVDGGAADAYVLSCDNRSPKMLTTEINDHGILVKRSKADVVGRYVTALANANLDRCHENAAPYFGKSKERRGCNSEMILKHVLEENGLKVKLVPQSLLPFERAVLLANDGNGNDNEKRKDDFYYCYHKFCQSFDSPLKLPDGIQKCKDLKF